MSWIAALIALLRAVLSLVIARQDRIAADDKTQAADDAAYVRTRQEMDHAEIVGDDPAAARRLLAARAAAHTAEGH